MTDDPTYSTIPAQLREALPEISPEHSVAEFGELSPFEAVSSYLNPMIEDAIKSDDRPLLRRIFGLIERMARSTDRDVVNLVWVEICEHLGGNDRMLPASRLYMGTATRDISDQVEIIMHGRDVILSATGREAVERKAAEFRATLSKPGVPELALKETRRILADLERALRHDRT